MGVVGRKNRNCNEVMQITGSLACKRMASTDLKMQTVTFVCQNVFLP